MKESVAFSATMFATKFVTAIRKGRIPHKVKIYTNDQLTELCQLSCTRLSVCPPYVYTRINDFPVFFCILESFCTEKGYNNIRRH